ncbi:hypothetical protein [Catenulispora subtropica]|uniref:Uncharacterized protein n=1 Tax=Catenulispora subtropica TaxID=450798 RepID=A0ABP5DPN6_9ACTN
MSEPADEAAELEDTFRTAAAEARALPEEMLLPWITAVEPAYRERVAQEAVRAAGFAATPAVVAALREVLSGAGVERRALAAAALGRAGDIASAAAIEGLLVELVEHANQRAFGFTAIALERVGDADAARRLQTLIPTAPDWAVYWINRVVKRLTGHSAPAPEGDWRADPAGYLDRVRAAWSSLDLAAAPMPTVAWGPATASGREAVVHDGRGVFALLPDDQGATSSWPEWDYSWCHGGERLYAAGSVCSTCEVWLTRVGWAPEHAVELAQSVRSAVADVRGLDPALLTAVEPLLGALVSSRYQLRLIDLPLEGLVHESPEPERPLVIAPTQQGLDPATVEQYEDAIASGARPAAVVVAHVNQRQAWDADEPRTSLTGFVLDGHHKLTAYANLDTPARVLLIADRTPPLPTAPDPLSAFDRLIAEAGGRDAH